MRKHQHTLMLVITIVVIISFVWLYNGQRGADPLSNRVGSVYGRPVSVTQYGREARKFEICRALGMSELWITLIGRQARDENQAVENFVWNSLVLRQEARALGIEPTQAEMTAAGKQIEAFQTNGGYDSTKYNQFVERIGSRGFTGEQIDELLHDELCFKKLKTLVGATVSASPAEVRNIFELRNQKSQVSVLSLKMEEFLAAVKITDEELKALFEQRKDSLKSDELRKVKYVGFVLEKTDKPLAGKERVAALSKLGDRAQEFALAMTENGAKFEDVAKTFGLEVKQTAEFALHNPPAEIGTSEDTARTVFEKLSPAQPNSDVTMNENGYFVLQLAGVTPARPLSFDEAKASLSAQTKQERAQETLNLKAAELRPKLLAEIKAGKSFSEAATALGQKAQTLSPFSMIEPPKEQTPELQAIVDSAFQLSEGQLSEAVPTPQGLVLVHLDKRLPVDEKQFDGEKTSLSENVSRRKRDSVFEGWLKERRGLAQAGQASA